MSFFTGNAILGRKKSACGNGPAGGKKAFDQKVQKWTTKDSMHFWEMGFASKSAKMDQKKIVYTSGRWALIENDN